MKMRDRISAGRTENNGDCCCKFMLLRKLMEGAVRMDSVGVVSLNVSA